MQVAQDADVSATVLFEKDGKFVAYQPGLALIASGDSAADAYRKFSDAKQTFFDEVVRAGFPTSVLLPSTALASERELPQVGQVVSRRGLVTEFGIFVGKVCIVLLILGGLVGLGIDRLSGAIAGSGLGNISIVDVANKASMIARDVSAMPEDRKEALRLSVGYLSRQLEPIAEAWRNPPTDEKSLSNPKQ